MVNGDGSHFNLLHVCVCVCLNPIEMATWPARCLHCIVCESKCAPRNNYRLNFIINSFIFVTKWEVICSNRCFVCWRHFLIWFSLPVYVVLRIDLLPLLCMRKCTVSIDVVVMTQHCSNCAENYVSFAKQSTFTYSHSRRSFLPFLTVIFGPFSCSGVSTATKMTRNIKRIPPHRQHSHFGLNCWRIESRKNAIPRYAMNACNLWSTTTHTRTQISIKIDFATSWFWQIYVLNERKKMRKLLVTELDVSNINAKKRFSRKKVHGSERTRSTVAKLIEIEKDALN